MAFKISSAEEIPRLTSLTQGEELVGTGRRAILWHDGRPFGKYRKTVTRHVKFSVPELTPMMVALRPDPRGGERDVLIWVEGKTSPNESPYFKVVRGGYLCLDMTFLDGQAVNQRIATENWGFTVSLYTDRRDEEPLAYRAVTQIRADWLPRVDTGPDVDELGTDHDAKIEDGLRVHVHYQPAFQSAAPSISGGLALSIPAPPLAPAPPLTSTEPDVSISTWTLRDLDDVLAGVCVRPWPSMLNWLGRVTVDLDSEVRDFFDTREGEKVALDQKEMLETFRQLELVAKSVATEAGLRFT